MAEQTTELLFALWKRYARGDKLTTAEGRALDEALVHNQKLRDLIKDPRKEGA